MLESANRDTSPKKFFNGTAWLRNLYFQRTLSIFKRPEPKPVKLKETSLEDQELVDYLREGKAIKHPVNFKFLEDKLPAMDDS